MNWFKINKLKNSLKRTYKQTLKLINNVEEFCMTMQCKQCIFRNGKEKDCFISNMKNYAIELQKVCENIEKNT